MSRPLFDDRARRLRRDRAARRGGDRFLHDRAFDDCLDRLADVRRTFDNALIAGCPDPQWRDRLGEQIPLITAIESVEPGSLPAEAHSFDLCLSIGQLESVNDVQAAAFELRHMLRPGGLLIGAIVGGNSLPRLRAAMLAADRLAGVASPRIHPRIDGPSLAALLASVGLVEPVVDVDRLDVQYPDLDRLVGDLRSMGCTNILADRLRRSIGRRALNAARTAFLDTDNPPVERFELLHFAAWAPPQ